MKTMTIDNYQTFKPSEFIRSFASDVEAARRLQKKLHIPMDMSDFQPYRKNGKLACLPCMGGMALMDFGMPDDVIHYDEKLKTVAFIGDDIRIGDYDMAVLRLKDLYPKFKPFRIDRGDYIVSSGSDWDLDNLVGRVHALADLIENSGQ